MAHPNEGLVREGVAAFGRGGLAALQRQYIADDVRSHFPGGSPLAGDYQGMAEVAGWLGRSFELAGGTIALEVRDVVADDHAVALFPVRAERAGRRLEDRSVRVFRVRDGKASAVWTHPGGRAAASPTGPRWRGRATCAIRGSGASGRGAWCHSRRS